MKKVIYLCASFFFKPLCSLVVLRVLANTFGETGFGYLTQYMSFLAVVFGLTLGGANNYLVKNLAQAKDTQSYERQISIAFTYGFAFFLLLAVLAFAFKPALESFIFYRQVSGWAIAYLLLVFLLSNISGILMAVVLVQGKTHRYVWSNAGGAVVFVACVAALMALDLQAWIYWVLPLSYVLPGVFLYGAFEGKIRIDFRYLLRDGRLAEVVRYCLIVYIGLVSIPVVSLLFREHFSQHFGAVELSYWQAAVKISDTIQQFYGMFCAVILLPYLSRKIGTLTFRIWLLHLVGISALFMTGAFAIYGLRDYVVLLLFGDRYGAVTAYLPLYLAGDYFRAMALLCSYTMIASGRYGLALVFEALQGVLAVAFYYGIVGDSALHVGDAYLATYASCFTIMLMFVYLYFKRRAQ